MIFIVACDIFLNSVNQLINIVKFFAGGGGIMNKEEILDETLRTLAHAARANALNFFQINLKGENALLMHLIDCGGQSTPSKLAEVLNVSAARIAAMLRSLEIKKLIERLCDEKDKRRVTVKITNVGRDFVESVSAEMNKRAQNLLERLGEEDAKEFLRILKKCTGLYEPVGEESSADTKPDGKNENKNENGSAEEIQQAAADDDKGWLF